MKKGWQEVCCSLGFHHYVEYKGWSYTYRACEHCWVVHLKDLLR